MNIMMENQEGYYDPTPAPIILEEIQQERMLRRLHGFMRFAKFTAEQFGFELTERIVLRDKRSGKILR